MPKQYQSKIPKSSKVAAPSSGRQSSANTEKSLSRKRQSSSIDSDYEELPAKIVYSGAFSENYASSATAERTFITDRNSQFQQSPWSDSIQSVAEDHCKVVEDHVTSTSTPTTTSRSQQTSTSAEERPIWKQPLWLNVPDREELAASISDSGIFSKSYLLYLSSQTGSATTRRPVITYPRIPIRECPRPASIQLSADNHCEFVTHCVKPMRKKTAGCIIL
ncbi:unnamed protein product [Anisakis simplex]|uniref:Uncharacterized protein n=1 Tax=Anisakis simplex TaxID=6269 RepID=A0A0M3KD21_ANISI|nr:unnamed protein product [Anisakis simplex]